MRGFYEGVQLLLRFHANIAAVQATVVSKLSSNRFLTSYFSNRHHALHFIWLY